MASSRYKEGGEVKSSREARERYEAMERERGVPA